MRSRIVLVVGGEIDLANAAAVERQILDAIMILQTVEAPIW
jgi:hypothetical protein